MADQPNQKPLDLSKALDPSLWPDVATWRKALPQILSFAGSIALLIGAGNWVGVGQEALKDIPSILGTLGLAIPGGILTWFAGPLVDFLNHKDRASGQAAFDALAKEMGLYDGTVTPTPVPQPVQPVTPQPAPAPQPIDPNETTFAYDSGGVHVSLRFKPNADGQTALDMLSAAVGKKPAQRVIDVTPLNPTAP